MLDSHEVKELHRVAHDFCTNYYLYQLHPESGIRRAVALSSLGALEQAVKDHVSRETSRMAEEYSDGTQPPF